MVKSEIQNKYSIPSKKNTKERKYQPNTHTCKSCKSEKYVIDISEWAYKRDGNFFCKWSCMVKKYPLTEKDKLYKATVNNYEYYQTRSEANKVLTKDGEIEKKKEKIGGEKKMCYICGLHSGTVEVISKRKQVVKICEECAKKQDNVYIDK